MIATIAVITVIAEKKKSSVIAAIIWKPLSRVCSDNDRWDRKNSISAINVAAIATIAGKWFPYDHYDLYPAITVLFFSVITVIIAIIWKPGLSYTSLLHKIRFNNYKQEGCIMLFTYSCFNCQNEKGLLNFVSERINIVYRINNTRYNFQKNKLPFKHLKPQFMGPILSN